MNERELIARLQKRDEAAFEELIRQYEKKVYTLCFRMCGNSEDAEEAAPPADVVDAKSPAVAERGGKA